MLDPSPSADILFGDGHSAENASESTTEHRGKSTQKKVQINLEPQVNKIEPIKSENPSVGVRMRGNVLIQNPAQEWKVRSCELNGSFLTFFRKLKMVAAIDLEQVGDIKVLRQIKDSSGSGVLFSLHLKEGRYFYVRVSMLEDAENWVKVLVEVRDKLRYRATERSKSFSTQVSQQIPFTPLAEDQLSTSLITKEDPDDDIKVYFDNERFPPSPILECNEKYVRAVSKGFSGSSANNSSSIENNISVPSKDTSKGAGAASESGSPLRLASNTGKGGTGSDGSSSPSSIKRGSSANLMVASTDLEVAAAAEVKKTVDTSPWRAPVYNDGDSSISKSSGSGVGNQMNTPNASLNLSVIDVIPEGSVEDEEEEEEGGNGDEQSARRSSGAEQGTFQQREESAREEYYAAERVARERKLAADRAKKQAAADKAAEDARIAAEKEKKMLEREARLAAEKAAKDAKIAAEKLAESKAAAEKLERDAILTAERLAKEKRLYAEKVAREKAAAEKIAAEKKLAAEKAAEKAAQDEKNAAARNAILAQKAAAREAAARKVLADQAEAKREADRQEKIRFEEQAQRKALRRAIVQAERKSPAAVDREVVGEIAVAVASPGALGYRLQAQAVVGVVNDSASGGRSLFATESTDDAELPDVAGRRDMPSRQDSPTKHSFRAHQRAFDTDGLLDGVEGVVLVESPRGSACDDTSTVTADKLKESESPSRQTSGRVSQMQPVNSPDTRSVSSAGSSRKGKSSPGSKNGSIALGTGVAKTILDSTGRPRESPKGLRFALRKSMVIPADGKASFYNADGSFKDLAPMRASKSVPSSPAKQSSSRAFNGSDCGSVDQVYSSGTSAIKGAAEDVLQHPRLTKANLSSNVESYAQNKECSSSIGSESIPMRTFSHSGFEQKAEATASLRSVSSPRSKFGPQFRTHIVRGVQTKRKIGHERNISSKYSAVFVVFSVVTALVVTILCALGGIHWYKIYALSNSNGLGANSVDNSDQQKAQPVFRERTESLSNFPDDSGADYATSSYGQAGDSRESARMRYQAHQRTREEKELRRIRDLQEAERLRHLEREWARENGGKSGSQSSKSPPATKITALATIDRNSDALMRSHNMVRRFFRSLVSAPGRLIAGLFSKLASLFR
jgi:hypothetical protein